MLKLRLEKLQKAPIIYIWAFVIGLFVLSLGLLSSRFFTNITKEDEIDHLNRQALLISSVVKPEIIESLIESPNDTVNPEFIKLKTTLESFCSQLNSIRYIYILNKKDDKLFFIIDTESEENRKKSVRKTALPGEQYSDAPKCFSLAFSENKITTTDAYTDQWGQFISVIIPIKNRLGNTIAILGVDVEISYWESSLRIKKMFPIAISLIFIALILSIAIVLRYKMDLHKEKIILASRLEKFYQSNDFATFFFDIDYKVLYFNEKAIAFSAIFLTQPLKVGKKFIDTIKDEQHKKNLTDNTQLLFSENRLEVNIRYLNMNFKLLYQYIQPTELDIPFISLSIIDTTHFEQMQRANLLLNSINTVTEVETKTFSFTTSEDFIIDYVSPQAFNVIGFQPESIKRLPIISIFSTESYREFVDLLDVDRDSVRLNATFNSINKQRVSFKTKVSRIVNDEEPPFYLFTCSNIEFQEEKLPNQVIADLYRVQNTMDGLPGFAYRCKFDSNWTMTYLSKGFEKVCGYAITDVLFNQRISFNDIIMPKYRQNLVRLWDEGLSKHQHFNAEYEIMTAKGEHKWVWEQGYGIYNSDDTILELYGFIFDISPFKYKELENKKEIDALKNYIDDAQQGFVQIDNESNIIRVNQSLLDSLCNSIDVLRALKFSDIVHPSSENEYTVFINTLLAQNYAEAELLLISSENKKIPVFANAKRRDENEIIINIMYLASIPQSVLKNHAFDWEQLLNSIQTPICVIDHKERVVSFSNSAFNHYNQEEILNSICQNSDDVICSINQIIDSIENGLSFSNCVYQIRNDNKFPLTLIASINSIRENGEFCFTILSFFDISQTTQENEMLVLKNNQLNNKLVSKSQFYLSAGNDIRSTFNTIIGNAEIFLNGNLDDTFKGFAQNIKDTSIEAIEAINSIIDLAKMESGNLDFVFDPFYPEDVLSELISSYAQICEMKGLQFNANIDEKLLNEIVSDEILIKKALSGILSNVVEQTQNGSVSVNFDLINQTNSFWLKVTILNTDTAVSIELLNSQEETSISDPQPYKYDSSIDINFAICLNVIELLNGSFNLSNRIGIGSALEIKIPIVFSDKNGKESSSLNSAHIQVLIATPNSDDMRSMEYVFNGLKVVPNFALTGIEAAQIITKLSKEGVILDFVFIDFSLSGMSYEEVIDVLKTNGCNNFYVMCKHIDYNIFLEKHNGSINVLTKPILPSVLRKIIRSNPPKIARKNLSIEFVKLPNSFTILVVEDNAINLLMLKEILTMSDANILEATDGQEAYVSFLTNQPDLIFMDIHMPTMNGFESTKMIRNYCKENPAQKNPTIIALTANTINNLKINYKMYELDGFISKPYQILDIQQCLTKFKSND